MTETETRTLEDRIRDLVVAPGTAACIPLGQAGYIFKSPAGVTVMVDAYLSDYAEEMWGMKRTLPPVVDPDRFVPDLFLSSHWHEDHLDAPLVRRYATEPNVVLGGPESCTVRAGAWGWPADRLVMLNRGMSHELKDVRVTATFARHDEEIAFTGDAAGFLIEIDGVKIWDVADSEYDARLRPMRDEQVDVVIVPINGVGGNMTAHEAALLIWHVAPKLAVPMHYDMWAPETYGVGATLDPATFEETLLRLGGASEVRILTAGEIATFTK